MIKVYRNETTIGTCNDLDFCEAHILEDGQVIHSDVFLTIDGETIGRINLDVFDSLDDALKWAKKVIDDVMKHGYFDLCAYERELEIY